MVADPTDLAGVALAARLLMLASWSICIVSWEDGSRTDLRQNRHDRIFLCRSWLERSRGSARERRALSAYGSSDQESYCSAVICSRIHAGTIISAVKTHLRRLRESRGGLLEHAGEIVLLAVVGAGVGVGFTESVRSAALGQLGRHAVARGELQHNQGDTMRGADRARDGAA
jgi:hypothetical protein